MANREKVSNSSDQKNTLRKKALALVGAGALMLSLEACGGETSGDQPTKDVETTQSVEPTDSDVDKTSNTENVHAKWLETLTDEEKADYDRLAPDNLASMSMEEITDAFAIPKEKVLDENGEIDPKKVSNQWAIHVQRARESGCAKETLIKEGFMEPDGGSVLGLTQEERKDFEDKYLMAASAGFMYDKPLMSGKGAMNARCTRAYSMSGDGQPRYEQYITVTSNPEAIVNSNAIGSPEISLSFTELWEDNVDSKGLSEVIGSDPNDPGQTGRINSPLNTTIDVYFDGNNVRYDSIQESKNGNTTYEFWNWYDEKLENVTPMDDGSILVESK